MVEQEQTLFLEFGRIHGSHTIQSYHMSTFCVQSIFPVTWDKSLAADARRYTRIKTKPDQAAVPVFFVSICVHLRASAVPFS
jgi:hypothetical protein